MPSRQRSPVPVQDSPLAAYITVSPLCGPPGSASEYQGTAVVPSGTNVSAIDDAGGTNDPISASLLGTFVKRVQALYKHH